MKLFGVQKNKRNIRFCIVGIKFTFRTKPKNKTTLSEIYDEDFYKAQAESSYQSGREVLSLVSEILPNIQSVLDIGCGVGTWLKAWQDTKENIVVLGVDGNGLPENFLYIPKSSLLTKDILQLTPADIKKKRFGLTQCLEVAEHLPEASANNFINILTSFSDIILFSAAIPNQGGHYHLNEQPLEYWNEKFRGHGFECFDILRTKIWDNPNICWWYRQNVVLYAKGAAKKLLINKGYIATKHIHTMYHPEFVSAHFNP